MRILTRCFFTLVFSFLVAAGIQVHRPVSWSHLRGINDAKPARNLADAMEQALLRKDAELKLSESEINRFLDQKLDFQSEGPWAHAYQLNKVGIHFEKDVAQVCFQWSILGRWKSTASIDLTLHRTEKHYLITPISGQLGRLPVPAGLAAVLSPSLKALVQSLNGELKEMFKMQDLRIEDGALALHPIREKNSAPASR